MAQSEPILTDDDRAVWARGCAPPRSTRARRPSRARSSGPASRSSRRCEWVARHPVPGRTAPRCERVEWQRLDGDAPPDRRARGCKHVVAVTQQDDLDYPGEHEFAAERAARLGIAQHLIVPTISARVDRGGRAPRRDHVLRRRAHAPRALGADVLPADGRDNLTRGLAFLGLRRSRATAIASRVGDPRAWRRREDGEDGPNSGLTRWQ